MQTSPLSNRAGAALGAMPRAVLCAVALACAAPGAAMAQAGSEATPGPQPQIAAPEDGAAVDGVAVDGVAVDGAASDGAASDGAAASAADPAALPHDLSPWGMFVAADIVVQAVMVGLALASVLTWTVLQVKLLELRRAHRRAREVQAALGAARSLADLAGRFGAKDGPAGGLVAAAADELRLSADALDKDGIKERISLSFARIEAAAARRMMRATGLLATIGSTAPFVGLFGTVWGIMNSFIGISEAHTTNLAVVAPGIAEALLATALGLVAAVPAVVIYNGFARAIAGYRAALGDASAEVMRLVSRDLDRAARPYRDAAE